MERESVAAVDDPGLELLRERVRAARWGSSAPMLVFGTLTLVFAGYQAFVAYYYWPMPAHWPLCSLIALIVLWLTGRARARRSGVGEGRRSYGKAAAVLAGVIVAGNVAWLLPFGRMLLWPASVLTLLALWQRNPRLARWSGGVAVAMIAGWWVDVLLLGDVPEAVHRLLGIEVAGHFAQALHMAAGGAVLVVAGLVERVRERRLA